MMYECVNEAGYQNKPNKSIGGFTVRNPSTEPVSGTLHDIYILS